MADNNLFTFYKKLLPVIAKEEGDVINRRLAKEVAERGAQLDNPTMAEQLKSIQLPEDKVNKIPNEVNFQRPVPSDSLGDVIPDVPKKDILYQDPIPSEGVLGDVIPGTKASRSVISDDIDLIPPSKEAIGPFDMSSEQYGPDLASKWDWLKNNKGKILAGGAAASGAYALSRDGGDNSGKKAIVQSANTEQPNQTIKPAEIVQPESEEEKAIKKELASLSAPSTSEKLLASQLTTVDFGGSPSIASLERLQQLQNQANEESRWLRFAQAFSQARAGMSGQSEDRFSKGYDDDIKAAQSIPEQYKQQVAFEKEDPNSPISKGYRDLAKKVYDIDIQGSASAADIEKQFPQFANLKTAKEARLARSQDLKLRLAEIGSRNAERNDMKLSADQNKWIEKTGDKMVKRSDTFSKIKKASAMIDEAVRNPSAIGDMSALYSLISALDPASTVREGEVGLAKSAGGLIGRLEIGLKQLSTNPRLINKKSLNDIRATIKQLETLNDQEYGRMREMYYTQARARKIDEKRFSEFDPYYKPIEYNVPSVPKLPNKPEIESTKTQPNELVKVRLPDGRIGRIPKQNLDAAVSAGAQEIK